MEPWASAIAMVGDRCIRSRNDVSALQNLPDGVGGENSKRKGARGQTISGLQGYTWSL